MNKNQHSRAAEILAFEDRMTLTFDKGLRSFEEFSVPDSDYDDIDEAYLKEYLQMIGYRKPPRDYLLNNKNFAKMQDGKFKSRCSTTIS